MQRTDNNGNVLHTYQYDAFGNEFFHLHEYVPYSDNPFRFGGEYWDWERGEYYLRARSYNPRLGRFTQADPHWGLHNMVFGDSPTLLNGRLMPSVHAILQAANLFVFVMNNPVNWVDPSGRAAAGGASALRYPSDCKGIGSIAGVVGIGLGLAIATNLPTNTRDDNDSVGSIADLIREGGVGTGRNTAGDIHAQPPNNSQPQPQQPKPPPPQRPGNHSRMPGAGQNPPPGGAPATQDPSLGNRPPGGSNVPRFPGNNPVEPPGPGFEWRGSGPPGSQGGNWFNPKTGESLRPDLNHPPPIGPHWDYRPFRGGPWYRILPDGTIVPKP